eukprot:TRINITY_DN92197_c0_g1_i1.p1 TRINITY_DN92197_c0_g1~~TRINITY_DN92197_c0_g1_i1.p1  ORF type:complete len:164 (+),score=44.37 TRINITY_DN92197_c0_g1_i1:30-521(+)
MSLRRALLALLLSAAALQAASWNFLQGPASQASLPRRQKSTGPCRAWDDAIPDLPEEWREIGPLKLGPRPRPFGLLLMPFILFVYFKADSRKALFRQLDTNGDQLLSTSELTGALPPGASTSALPLLFQGLDKDGSGALESKEWLFNGFANAEELGRALGVTP